MSQTHKVAIDDGKIEFAYFDSGPPAKATYRTLICLHGFIFHAGNFSKILPLAPENDFRFIAIQRRGYPGSTPFLDDAPPTGSDVAAQSAFLHTSGLQIAKALVRIIEMLELPPLAPAGDDGGISLMGWSLGSITAMSFLRFFPAYPEDIRLRLRAHLNSLILYDPPCGPFGHRVPEGITLPQEEPSLPDTDRGRVSCEWVSAFHKHPFFCDPGKKEKIPANLITHLPSKDEKYRPSTFETFDAEEVQACLFPGGAAVDGPLLRFNMDVYRDLSLGTYIVGHGQQDSVDAELPDLKIKYISCESSFWLTTAAVWLVQKDLDEWKATGRQLRPATFKSLPDANHCLHWEDPGRFASVCREILFDKN